MRRRSRIFSAAATIGAICAITPTGVFACSPPFEPITLDSLGPDQVVVVGRIGDRVPGGRVFHVERWFNGPSPASEILIAFKEGPAVGDCSYPVQTGQHLIIAPDRQDDGLLHADLVTPQGDPDQEPGKAYLAEAVALYGQGVVPPVMDVAEVDTGPPWAAMAALAIVVALAASVVILRSRRGDRSD